MDTKTIRIPTQLYLELKSQAFREERTLTAVASRAISSYIRASVEGPTDEAGRQSLLRETAGEKLGASVANRDTET